MEIEIISKMCRHCHIWAFELGFYPIILWNAILRSLKHTNLGLFIACAHISPPCLQKLNKKYPRMHINVHSSGKYIRAMNTPEKPHIYLEKLGFAGVYLFFLFLLQNIDCGYALEPPQRGGSNSYPQSMF